MLQLICLVLQVYLLVILGVIVLSWFPMQPGTGLERVYTGLRRVTDPVLGPVRRAVPAIRLGGMALDISPIIVILGLSILRGFVC